MMDSEEHTICRLLERPIEIYENQRFWVGRGWRGLLPTERKAYSTEDGSLSWRTVREAALSLLRYDVAANSGGRSKRRQGRRGWSYHEYVGRQQTQSQAVGEVASASVSDEEGSDHECSVEDLSDDSRGRLSLDERCGFEVYIDEDATCDHEGWSYYPDFNPNSMMSPSNHRLVPRLWS